jgi:hypothetical protein
VTVCVGCGSGHPLGVAGRGLFDALADVAPLPVDVPPVQQGSYQMSGPPESRSKSVIRSIGGPITREVRFTPAQEFAHSWRI